MQGQDGTRLMVLGALASGALVASIVCLALHRKVEGIRGDLEAQRARLEAERELVQRVLPIIAARNRRSRLEERFNEPGALLRFIETCARQKGIPAASVRSIQPITSDREGGEPRVGVRVLLEEVPMEPVARFLHSVEEGAPGLTVEDLSLNASRRRQGAWRVDAVLSAAAKGR